MPSSADDLKDRRSLIALPHTSVTLREHVSCDPMTEATLVDVFVAHTAILRHLYAEFGLFIKLIFFVNKTKQNKQTTTKIKENKQKQNKHKLNYQKERKQTTINSY
jgi:hypothetical protein